MTNREWVNTLSDHELAKLFYSLPQMREAFITWLKKERESESGNIHDNPELLEVKK